MNYKRVTVFAGHYGSGKTNVAVNYALALKAFERNVSIADLDIVNPYFRTKDSADVLEKGGIRLISSAYAGSNIDIPALPPEIYSVVRDKSFHAVMDVGGDDRGATALGRYVPYLLAENDFEMLFVVNMYRPLTADPKSAFDNMREIEAACGARFTSVVNNSNLGAETTAEDILASVPYAEKISALSGIPIKMNAVRKDIAAELGGKIENIFPISLHVYGFMN